MRVCMLTSFFIPTVGGVENHVYHLCKELLLMGHEVTVVHTCYDMSSTEQIQIEKIDGIEVHRLYLGLSKWNCQIKNFPIVSSYVNGFLRKCRPIFYNRFIARYILNLHKEKRFDILHQHDFISNLFTTKKLRKYIPVVITNHTGEYLLLNRYMFTKLLIPFLLKHINALIGPSRELAEVKYLEKKGRAFYIPNGVDIQEFYPLSENEKKKIKEYLNVPLDRTLILCARRWAPTKGVIYLVRAIKSIRENCPNAYFLISGNDYFGYPEYRNMILKEIEEQNIAEDIKLLGDIPHEKMAAYDQIADVVVLPSLLEATSLSGLEAMACGASVVGSKVGGIPEIIEDGRNGYLVPAQNVVELADALIKIIKDEKVRKIMGGESRKKVESEFTWQIITKKTMDVYLRVLGKI